VSFAVKYLTIPMCCTPAELNISFQPFVCNVTRYRNMEQRLYLNVVSTALLCEGEIIQSLTDAVSTAEMSKAQ